MFLDSFGWFGRISIELLEAMLVNLLVSDLVSEGTPGELSGERQAD